VRDIASSSREKAKKANPIKPKARVSRTKGRPALIMRELENENCVSRKGLKKYRASPAAIEKARIRQKYRKASRIALRTPGIPDRPKAITRYAVFIALETERARAIPRPLRSLTRVKASTMFTPNESKPAQVGVLASERA
jgi:hypothetical protein